MINRLTETNQPVEVQDTTFTTDADAVRSRSTAGYTVTIPSTPIY
jgi:hypothetical protein